MFLLLLMGLTALDLTLCFACVLSGLPCTISPRGKEGESGWRETEERSERQMVRQADRQSNRQVRRRAGM